MILEVTEAESLKDMFVSSKVFRNSFFLPFSMEFLYQFDASKSKCYTYDRIYETT
jgi:hypothetical protein